MTVYELLHKTSMDKIISVIKTRTNSADFGEMEVFIKHILKLDPVINDNSDLVLKPPTFALLLTVLPVHK